MRSYIDISETSVAQIVGDLLAEGYDFNFTTCGDTATLSAFGKTAIHLAESMPDVALITEEDEFWGEGKFKYYVNIVFRFWEVPTSLRRDLGEGIDAVKEAA